jgi:acetolactate synthase-1/2/3 large subunit
MAAEAYARIAEQPPILNVTTGPGGINALNGVFGAWTDSVPMIVISGQVKRTTCLATTPVPGLRQLGDQECDPPSRSIATARTARSSRLLLLRPLRLHRLFWCAAA